MLRRRLLTILATAMLSSAALAGPAAASGLVSTTGDVVDGTNDTTVATTESVAPEPVADVVEEVAEAAEEATAAVEAVAPPVEEPDAVEAVEDAVRPAAPSSQPSTSDRTPSRTAPRVDDSPAHTPDQDREVRAAGGVTDAPPIEMLVAIGGSEPTDWTAAPVPMPAAAGARTDMPAMPTVQEPEAPLVATTPGAADAGPSVLAQPISGDVPAEDASTLALVALAALLAAGGATVRSARLETA